MTAGRVRVAVVDDQALVRDGFARAIRAQTDMQLVAVGSNGRDAVAIAADLRPDVVVVDIRMPVLDGIAATREILSAQNAPKSGAQTGSGTGSGTESGEQTGPRVLVVTTFSLDEYVFDALRAGASGFLLKDSPPQRLLDAIRTVARGEALVDPAVTRALIGAFADRIRPSAPDATSVDQLTPREMEVLRLLAQGSSNAEIAAALVVTRQTVKTYVSRILLKLGVRDRVQAVVLAYRAGIVRE